MGRALIIGAGPAGATLGLLLARAGVEVELLERHEDFSREFRGERVMPGGIRLLQEMGLGEVISSVPQLRILGTDVFVDGRRRYGFPFIDEAHAPTYLPQPPLLEIIVGEAARTGRFSLHRGAIVRDLVSDASGRIIGVAADIAGSSHQFLADVVIGSDGRASAIRRRASLTAPGDLPTEDYDVVWASAPAPPGYNDGNRAKMYLSTPGQLVFTLPAPNGGMQIGLMIAKGAYGRMRRSGQDWFENVTGAVSQELAAHLSANRHELKHSLLDVVCYELPKWWKPGLLLIGDAAHPMSPAGGQGIGMAIRDAVVTHNLLGPHLEPPSPDHRVVDEALAAVQAMRQPEIRAIQELQRRTATVYLQKSRMTRILSRRVAPLLARAAPQLMARSVGGRREITDGIAEVGLAPFPASTLDEEPKGAA